MKIQIHGYGYVGQAHADLIETSGHECFIYDPALDFNDLEEHPHGMIVAVSTPEGSEGECDMSNVYEAIERSPGGIPILIKSTISLEGWRLIQRAYPNEPISFSPEYLRAQHAIEDFRKQKLIRIGGTGVDFWKGILSSQGASVIEGDPEALIFAKYFRNSFLATKVAFFNQMYDLCQEANVPFHLARNYVIEDERIGSSHSIVMPPSMRGFGGHCLPKDTSAIVASGHQNHYDLSIIREAIRYNESLK